MWASYVSRDTLSLYILYVPSHSLDVVRNIHFQHLFIEPGCTKNHFFTETCYKAAVSALLHLLVWVNGFRLVSEYVVSCPAQVADSLRSHGLPVRLVSFMENTPHGIRRTLTKLRKMGEIRSMLHFL